MVDRYPLSEGTLRVMMQGGQVENPIMQVLGSKKITSGTSDKQRYRILLSDGKYLISYAMFSTHINERMVSGELPTFSIIKIKQYITSVINNTGKGEKRVLVILDVEILVPGDEVKTKIGFPEPLADEPELSRGSTSDVSSPRKQFGQPTTSDHVSSPRKQLSGPQLYVNNSTLNNSMKGPLTHPISSLSPYQNKWIIKARVVSKSPIKYWSNSRGEGKLFSMDLLDDSGQIRVTGFKDSVDKFFEMIEVDKVYYISKCQLKIANKKFSTIDNDYEMTLTSDSVIELCNDEIDKVPHTTFNFVPIGQIAEMNNEKIIDVIGICKSVGDVQTILAKTTKRELQKRDVTLVDTSNTAITLTLWGKEAENFDGSTNPVVAVKSAKIGEFGGGKNISSLSTSIVKINPDHPEAHRLRGWFDNDGVGNHVVNLSARTGGYSDCPWMSFKHVKESGLGSSERGDYYQVKATVLLVRPENIVYKACPTAECNKKIVDLENGMFRCEKCNREFPNFKYRLLVRMYVCDWRTNQWISMFSSEAEKILGMTAQEVGEAIESDPEAAANITSKANFKEFILTCRAKFETYNDEQRLKTVAVKVEPIKHKQYNSHLISNIMELMNQ